MSFITNIFKKFRFSSLYKFIFAIVAGLSISYLKLDYIESYLYDLRVTAKAHLGLSKANDSNIVLVLITSKTVESFQGFPDFEQHSNFLNILKKYNPKFLLYDFRNVDKKLVDINGTVQQQEKFVLATKSFEEFHIATQDLEMKGETGKLKLEPPLDQVNLTPCLKNPDTTLFAKDSVYRRIMLTYQDQILLHPLIASYYNKEISDLSNVRGQFTFLDSTQNYINYHPNGSFPTYSFEDVYNNKIEGNPFENKLVIVGTDTGKSPREYGYTPYSREISAMTSAEIHANSFQTLIENNSPTRTPKNLNIFVILLISILTVYVVLTVKPSKGLFIVGLTLFLISLLGIILFAFFNVWVDLAHPILAIFLCYYFFIPYRLIIENRRSWEYLQKNKLLQQVEELKTNFISMMSHDLKTPIARIQGMTEVILKDDVHLSSIQREAVDTIKGSSDDLLKFINSILQYGRIESQGVELHKQSKDINQILNDVIKKHEFLAKVKKIKITTELEPMFPVSVDVDLIKQVFSNLVENAIKYSLEESTVIVKSREEGDKVVIAVTDNGMGIPAEDLPNIFMKFYRSHNVKTSTIKGTGLGLYLAQYFAELHKGEISVVSNTDEGKHGSTFTVKLPLNP
ncbi:MAG: ATP-binding protein [Pseudobdellovibrio sp.]